MLTFDARSLHQLEVSNTLCRMISTRGVENNITYRDDRVINLESDADA